MINYQHINNFVDKIYCINLKSRVDRKKNMIEHIKKYNIKINFVDAIKHRIGWIGCLRSHLKIIKEAQKKDYEKILIMEDDCRFNKKPIIDINKIPKDWKMLYLGYNIQKILETDYDNIENKRWVKMSCLAMHCYIIHKSSYKEIIELIKDEKEPIDVYIKKYHYNLKCYGIQPMLADQEVSYSDIEKCIIKYKLPSVNDLIPIDKLPYIIDNGNYILKLKNISDDDLPNISLLTTTKNNKSQFKLAIFCFQNIDYPQNKIEWIIVDDSNNGDNLKDILPNDNRIRYIKLNTNKNISIAMKRNLCVKKSKYKCLLFFNDSDYYYPFSIKSRVKTLISNQNKKLIGCSEVCSYNIYDNFYSYNSKQTSYNIGSMTFWKSFWIERSFKHNDCSQFIYKRKKECGLIPFQYIMMNIEYKSNNENKKIITDQLLIETIKLPNHILEILKSIK